MDELLRLRVDVAGGLVQDEDRRVVEDGNHYEVYLANFDATVISLDDDEYEVRIFRRENAPDRFAQLWDDIGAQ